MKKLHTYSLRDLGAKKRLGGISVFVCALSAGFAGWYLRAHASMPPPDTTKADAIQPSLTLLHSLHAAPQSNIANSVEARIDQQTAVLLWNKAKREVEVRQKKLDKARMNYLRIRRALTKAGLSDNYTELARERVEEAADALREAQASLEQHEATYQALLQQAQSSQDLQAIKK